MKKMFKLIALFTTSSFILPACKDSGKTATDAGTKSAFDLDAAKKAIDETKAAFGDFIKKGDSTGVANLYASDAKVMGSNMPAITGKAAITSAFAGFINSGVGGATLTTTEVWGTESMVSEEGTYSLSDKSGKELDKGKYIVLWKMEDGKWKLFRDCWNSDAPLPAPAK